MGFIDPRDSLRERKEKGRKELTAELFYFVALIAKGAESNNELFKVDISTTILVHDRDQTRRQGVGRNLRDRQELFLLNRSGSILVQLHEPLVQSLNLLCGNYYVRVVVVVIVFFWTMLNVLYPEKRYYTKMRFHADC